MGRKATGHVEWRGGEWKTQVKDPATGRIQWMTVEEGLTQKEEDLARAIAVNLKEKWDGKSYVPLGRQLTVEEFFKRWQDSRRGKYPNQVDTDEQAYRLWIREHLGARPMHLVTADQLRAFSGWLDQKAEDGEDFGGKRARNIFSVVAAMFRDATSSKNEKIRILKENPCASVPWPEPPEGDPLHQLLYPHEFIALVACPDVPVINARLYAVTTYTTTRIGEVRMFQCDDIDVDNALVKITRAADNGKGKRGQAKLTKSNRSRITTLEATLAPLMAYLVETTKSGRIFPDRPEDLPKGNQWDRKPVNFIPGTSKVCSVFRRDLLRALAWAKIKVRPELVDKSDLRASQPIRFHDLRASGITWRHARGDNPSVIRQECGHENERTNEIYIRTLRKLRPEDLFPALPARLGGQELPPNSHQKTKKGTKKVDKLCRRRDLNPASDTKKGHGTRALGRIDHTSKHPSRNGSPQDALADAIRAASAQGKWDVVAKLAEQMRG